MIWLLLCISEIWFGFETCLILLFREINFFEIIGAGISVGISISTLIYYFFSHFIGNNVVHLIIHIVILFFISFCLFRKRRSTDKYVFRIKIVNFAPPFILSSLVLIFVLPLLLVNGNEFISIMSKNIHEELALTASFVNGCNSGRTPFFKLKHPDYFGHTVVSHWFVPYYLSMMRIGYCGICTSLIVSSFLFLTSFFIIIYSVCREFGLSFYVAPFVIILPLFNSGIGYFKFKFYGYKFERNVDFISNIGNGEKTHNFNPFYHILFCSRNMMLSLSISILSIHLLYRCIRCRNYVDSVFLMRFSGFLIGGILPGTNHQSFFAILIFSIFHCFIQTKRQNFRERYRNLFISTFISFILINSSFNC